MLDDNEMSLTLTRDSKSQNQTKHIDVMYQHICGLGEDRKLAIEWSESSTMLADGLTKALFTGPFKKHQDEWSLVD